MSALATRISRARKDAQAGRWTTRRILLENGLSLVVFTLFLLAWGGQTLTGYRVYLQDQRDHHQPEIGLKDYLTTGHFLEATAENWESEFLQMAAFVWLTAFLYQKGSPESNDPYEPEEKEPVTKDSPWPVRRGGWVLGIYANSLSLTFAVMFLICFFLHAAGGARAYSQEQLQHGQPAVGMIQYLGTSQFWFESFQN